MCGFAGVFRSTKPPLQLRAIGLEMAQAVRHRGPDWSGVYSDEHTILVHERLAIVDPKSGGQPLIDVEKRRVLAVNGEIYNHLALRRRLEQAHSWQTQSDCEVILYLYDEFGPSLCEILSGIFAFALYDEATKEFFVARDHLGIIPLYIGWDKEGATYVASEMKALDRLCDRVEEFPPGHYYIGSESRFTKWYNPKWASVQPKEPASPGELRESLERAVRQQLMSDVPYGVLISGGLDSSIVAAIAARFHEKNRSPGAHYLLGAKLHSFSVGLSNSPDLRFAREAASFIGTQHHEVTFTVQEGLDALRDVVRHLETFDVTSIRAATPMYLMARQIRALGLKMVLSGEGADEIFGGYLYFHMAPSAQEFHEETVRKLFLLSKYDCCRANKATAAWGIETRVPFLDREFLDVAMSLDPSEKMCGGGRIEKELLRRAFLGYLPDSILWRQKEQFSDGVGYGWIDALKEHVENLVSDQMMAEAPQTYPLQTPTSKEQYYYRTLFDSVFTNPTACLNVPIGPSIACSTPTAFRWSRDFAKRNDPSGRAVAGIHMNSLSSSASVANEG